MGALGICPREYLFRYSATLALLRLFHPLLSCEAAGPRTRHVLKYRPYKYLYTTTTKHLHRLRGITAYEL